MIYYVPLALIHHVPSIVGRLLKLARGTIPCYGS
jgi:hypothetical protein